MRILQSLGNWLRHTDSESETAASDLVTETTATAAATESEEELVAILTAAVMASLGTPTRDTLRITSFRRVEVRRPEWNLAGLREQM